jgi:hypothetical protein
MFGGGGITHYFVPLHDVGKLPNRSMARKEPDFVGRWLISSVVIGLFKCVTL